MHKKFGGTVSTAEFFIFIHCKLLFTNQYKIIIR
jgi:hypothetical protein